MARKQSKIKRKKNEKKVQKSPKNREIDSEIDDENLWHDTKKTVDSTKHERRKKEFEKEAMPHLNLLRNYAYRITGNELDADDLVQETYLRAFRFFHKFEKGTNCKAWLFRIMKNLFINNYRKNQKLPGTVDYEEIENFVDDIKSQKLESNDYQEKVFSSLLDDELTHALNSLHDDFKTVVILCDIEGLSYEEIAEFVNCPIGTVRSRIHRGRKLLQQALYNYAQNKGYDVENAMS